MLGPRHKLIERHLLFKEAGVGSSAKAVGLFEDSGLLGIVVLSNCILLAGAESHRVNAVGVVEELVLLGISFNVLPAIALPPAGDELHRAVCLLIRVGAVEVVAVETVVRGVEILGRNRVAMSWASFLIELFVSLRINRNLLHLLGIWFLGANVTSVLTAGTGSIAFFRNQLEGILLEAGRKDLLLTLGLLGKNFVSSEVWCSLGHF
jgi:uncharacterized membrane protein